MVTPQPLAEIAAVLDPDAFTRRLNSGLYVPDDELTAPIDVVDRHPAPPAPRPAAPAPPRPESGTMPHQPRPASTAADTQPQQGKHRATSAAPTQPTTTAVPSSVVQPASTPKSEGPSGWQRLGHALADRVELGTARRRVERAAEQARTAPSAEVSDITIAALLVVSAVTLAVSGLAFALSFDMMLEAAKTYGWGENLAKLFPILIDTGAIGGTFMGAISANRTYVHVGRSVLGLTLAASVLFNLVGHDVKGHALLGMPLPDQWKWTGTVAAIFIPVILAYFIHAFSKALKAYVDQERERKAAEAARAEQARQARDDAADAARRAAEAKAAAVTAAAERPATAPVAVPQQRPVRQPAAPQKSAGPQKAVRKAETVSPAPAVSREPARASKQRTLDGDAAYAWSKSNGHPGPTAVLKHFEKEGYEVPALSTLRSWINSRRDTETGSPARS